MTRRLWPTGALVVLVGVVALLGAPRAGAQGLRGEPVRCVVPISTATTLTAIGGDCALRPGFSLFVTDIAFSTNAAGITADSFNTLKTGTGTNCGTGTALVWGAMTPAATQATVVMSFTTPLRLPASTDLCWINSTAGSKVLVIVGFYSQ